MSVSDIPELVLLGCGNPLLDIQVNVEKDLLDKYEMKENDSILADNKHVSLFEEIMKYNDIKFIPGGATQNALRIFQWIVGKPNCATFFGAVGSDKYSQILEDEAKKSGVNVCYQVKPTEKTGTCAVLINKHHRSLCADLAAAGTFTVDHLAKPENDLLVKKAKFYYISGFFLTVCPPAILTIAKHAAQENKTFTMNLAAPFVSQLYSETLNQILPYMDILFANEEEAVAYANTNNLDTVNITEIAQKLAAIPMAQEKKNRSRLVIVTQGPESIVTVKDGKVCEFDVPRIETIVDTNGAGDAFCGGFLAEYVHGSELEKCIKCGIYAASVVIQHQGCTFPSKCDYKLDSPSF